MNLGNIGSPDLGFVGLVVVRFNRQSCLVRHGVVSALSTSAIAVSSKGSWTIFVGVSPARTTIGVLILVVILIAVTIGALIVPFVWVEFDVHQFRRNVALWLCVASVAGAHVA